MHSKNDRNRSDRSWQPTCWSHAAENQHKTSTNLPNRNAPHSDQHISNCHQATTIAASSSPETGSILGQPYHHTAPQHPSLMWDKSKPLLPAACPTLGETMPPPTIFIPQQAGGRDRSVAGELTCTITYQVISSNTSISSYSQKPSLFASQILVWMTQYQKIMPKYDFCRFLTKQLFH